METNITQKNEILFTSTFLIIEYDRDLKGLITSWHGILATEDFKKGINLILKCLEERQLKRILNDVTGLKMLAPEGQAYAAEAVGAFVKKHYYFKQAHLWSKDAFVRFFVRNFDNKLKKVNSEEINENFDNLEEARAWLFSSIS